MKTHVNNALIKWGFIGFSALFIAGHPYETLVAAARLLDIVCFPFFTAKIF